MWFQVRKIDAVDLCNSWVRQFQILNHGSKAFVAQACLMEAEPDDNLNRYRLPDTPESLTSARVIRKDEVAPSNHHGEGHGALAQLGLGIIRAQTHRNDGRC